MLTAVAQLIARNWKWATLPSVDDWLFKAKHVCLVRQQLKLKMYKDCIKKIHTLSALSRLIANIEVKYTYQTHEGLLIPISHLTGSHGHFYTTISIHQCFIFKWKFWLVIVVGIGMSQVWGCRSYTVCHCSAQLPYLNVTILKENSIVSWLHRIGIFIATPHLKNKGQASKVCLLAKWIVCEWLISGHWWNNYNINKLFPYESDSPKLYKAVTEGMCISRTK